MDKSGRLVPKRGLNFTLSNKREWKHTSALEFSIKTAPILAPLIEKMPTFLVNFQKMISGAKKYAYAKTDYTFLKKA